jgi:hypothetical protein
MEQIPLLATFIGSVVGKRKGGNLGGGLNYPHRNEKKPLIRLLLSDQTTDRAE